MNIFLIDGAKFNKSSYLPMDNYFLTTPIYYVNARPHLGHIYTTLMCDIMAAFQRNLGKSVYFLTGSDEHGDKIVKAAEKEKITPSEYVDNISGEFKKIWKELKISNSDFIRTTEERHKKIVKEVLQDLYDKGDIYLGSYEGIYCYGCERYLTEKELTEDGKCPDHQVEPEKIKEENYFFKLQKYLPLWEKQLEENPDLIRPEQYYREIMGTIQELKKHGEDLSISRPVSRLKWGIPIPFDENYVTYVWFDALFNYITALKDKGEDTYSKFWPSAHHVIAKDILKPHGIYWPLMLIASGYPLYKNLFVHGYWLGINNLKMSKSMENAVNPLELIESTGLDAFKYFLSREMIFGSDSKFAIDILQNRINLDLSNNLGNLVQRTLSMIKKYCSSKIPERDLKVDLYSQMQPILETSRKQYLDLMNRFQFSRALEALFLFITELNRLIEDKKPWEMNKTNPEVLPGFLRFLLDGIAVSMNFLDPFLPQKNDKFKEITGAKIGENFPSNFNTVEFRSDLPETWDILFPRLDLVEKES